MQIAENDFIKYWIEDGILYSEYKKPTDNTLENVKSMIALRHVISNNKKQCWCYDITLLKSYSKEGRDYADLHGQDYLHASAILVNSHVTMFLFNSFLKLKKLVVPVQVFKQKDKATKWLKEMKQKNQNT
jgi:hypothetical protein